MVFSWKRFTFTVGDKNFMTLPKSLYNYTTYLNKQSEKEIHIEPFSITGNSQRTCIECVCCTWMFEFQLPLRKRKLTLAEKAAVLINDRGICHVFSNSLCTGWKIPSWYAWFDVKEGMWRRRGVKQHPTHFLQKPFLGGGHSVNIEQLQKATENPEILD